MPRVWDERVGRTVPREGEDERPVVVSADGTVVVVGVCKKKSTFIF